MWFGLIIHRLSKGLSTHLQLIAVNGSHMLGRRKRRDAELQKVNCHKWRRDFTERRPFENPSKKSELFSLMSKPQSRPTDTETHWWMTNCIIKTSSRSFFLFLFLLPFLSFFLTPRLVAEYQCIFFPLPGQLQHSLLTLNNEVDVGGVGLAVGLDAARVRPFVGDLHLVDVDGEVAAVTVGQCDALV